MAYQYNKRTVEIIHATEIVSSCLYCILVYSFNFIHHHQIEIYHVNREFVVNFYGIWLRVDCYEIWFQGVFITYYHVYCTMITRCKLVVVSS